MKTRSRLIRRLTRSPWKGQWKRFSLSSTACVAKIFIPFCSGTLLARYLLCVSFTFSPVLWCLLVRLRCSVALYPFVVLCTLGVCTINTDRCYAGGWNVSVDFGILLGILPLVTIVYVFTYPPECAYHNKGIVRYKMRFEFY